MSSSNSNCSENLVLHCFPNSSVTSITDLTKNSSNCISKINTQVNYKLLNSKEIPQGTLNILTTSTINTINPNITSNIKITVIEIFTDENEKEIYSLNYYDELMRNDNGLVIGSHIIYVNLTSVSGNNTYTKLKWEYIAEPTGHPLYRILTFYN